MRSDRASSRGANHWRCALTLVHDGGRWTVIAAQSEQSTGSAVDPVSEVQHAVGQLWPSLLVDWASFGSDLSERPSPVDADVLSDIGAVGHIIAERVRRRLRCDRCGEPLDPLKQVWPSRARNSHWGAVRRDRCDACGVFVDPLAETLFWRPGSQHRHRQRCMFTLDHNGVRWTVNVAESNGDWPSDPLRDLRIAVDRWWPSLQVDWESLGPLSGGWPSETPAETDVVVQGRQSGGRVYDGRVIGKVLVGSL